MKRVTAPLPHEHPGFWAKLEGMGVGGMKVRAAMAMLDRWARCRTVSDPASAAGMPA